MFRVGLRTTNADLLAARQAELARDWKQAGLKGKIEFYVSKMDGKKRPYAVWATSDASRPKPLVVQVNEPPTDAGPPRTLWRNSTRGMQRRTTGNAS